MIAVRVPLCSSLGIVTVLGAGLLLTREAPPAPSAPAIDVVIKKTGCQVPFRQTQREVLPCDPDQINAVVIRGQFTSKSQEESFAISFSGASGQYTAMTDKRGYFEVHIPREDFDGDVCDIPLSEKDFSDDQMTLKYRIDVVREGSTLADL